MNAPLSVRRKDTLLLLIVKRRKKEKKDKERILRLAAFPVIGGR
jgi:hypothetical protein